MEDPGLGLLLKNGQRSQWEGEETMSVGGTVGKCLWVLLSKARQRVRRTESTLHAPRLSSPCAPPTTPFQSQSSSVVLEASWPCLNPIRNSV